MLDDYDKDRDDRQFHGAIRMIKMNDWWLRWFGNIASLMQEDFPTQYGSFSFVNVTTQSVNRQSGINWIKNAT